MTVKKPSPCLRQILTVLGDKYGFLNLGVITPKFGTSMRDFMHFELSHVKSTGLICRQV